jgi:hypothetical protein
MVADSNSASVAIFFLYMLTWPWTNLKKELNKRVEEVESGEAKLYTFEEVKESLFKYKPTKWERFWFNTKFGLHELTWKVYRFFKPCHSRIRNAIPKQWCDLTELTLMVNFEIIKSFVEDEMDVIDWDHSEETRAAAAWLKSSYKYITEERKELQDNLEIAYSGVDYTDKDLTYQEKYKEVIQIEEKINDTDKDIIIGLANHRAWLWS